MANDRLYIQCAECKQAVLLAKDHGVGFTMWPDAVELHAWMAAHLESSLSRSGPPFVFRAESDSDFDEWSGHIETWAKVPEATA